MLKKRTILFISIVLLTVVCLLIMNRNYDPLARYAYKDSKTDQIIINNLSDKEIDYIIDYSISPDEFIDYINAYNFNIYHVDYYNYAKNNLYYVGNDDDIVNICERLLKKKLDVYGKIDEYRYFDTSTIYSLIDQA